MNHVVGALRILNQSEEEHEECSNHYRKHDRVCSVERVLLDQVRES